MPLPFEDFQRKGDFELFSSFFPFPSSSSSCSFSDSLKQDNNKVSNFGCYAGTAFSEPTSVLESIRSPSPLAATSSSTLSSSHGAPSGAGDADTKCGGNMGPEDWDTVLSESPRQEHSILKLIMGEIDDPHQYADFNSSGFDVFDPGLGFESLPPGPEEGAGNLMFCPPQSVSQDQFVDESVQEKSQFFNQSVIVNQNQSHFGQTPSLFIPGPFGPVQEQYPSQPPAKRHNSGQSGFVPVFQVPVSDQFVRRTDDQSGLTEQLFKAAELIGGGESVTAQGILARLNHQLCSPNGKSPFQRAAFYFSQALQLLLLRVNSASNPSPNPNPFNLVFKISAHKSFSEVSPLLQFANFTCNQILIESLQGFNRIHIVDFDIGYGGQWASLMQELILRKATAPSVRITAVSSPADHDELELRFTCENLRSFAGELKIAFDIEVISLQFWSSVARSSLENEAVAVNLPIGSVSDHELPLVLRSMKQISPDVVISIEKGSDRTDAPFPHRVIHALQSYSSVLESLDAVSMNQDAMQKIERFVIQTEIEKVVMKRHNERLVPWRALFVQLGFSPLTLSNLTEAQAECLLQRSPILGFHVEKRRRSSLVLCWQRKELVSVSAWTR